MSAVISPSKLAGTLPAPFSKSLAHRAIIGAALAGGTVFLDTSALPDDILATIRCLEALGTVLDIKQNSITVTRRIDVNNIPRGALLDCGESGTTARFLLPLAAMFAFDAVITGSESLQRRPMTPVLRTLEAHGAVFDGDTLPVKVIRNADHAGAFEIDGSVSSQFISGLLIALPFCEKANVRVSSEPVSAPYIALTAEVLRHFGIEIIENGGSYISNGTYTPPPSGYIVEGDASGAAFFLAAATNGHDITVTNLPASSRQGDMRMLDILKRMGDTVTQSGNAVTVHANGKRHGIDTDITNTPDLAPILAVLAASADGRSILRGTARLRIKESDRENAVSDMINDLGGHCRVEDDCLIIDGGGLCGGKVNTHGDHRIAMAAAVAAVYCSGDIEIDNMDCVRKSYTLFEHDYTMLGGRIRRR